MTHHVYLHSEDLDGWLAPTNYPILPGYLEVLRRLQGLSRVVDGVLHEVQVVLNSGKGPDYLEAQARHFGGRYVIAGTGSLWREVGGATRPFVPPAPDLARLRALLSLPPGAVDVVRPRIGPREVELVIEGGKLWQGSDLVISFFPEAGPVAHRWSFRQGTDRHALSAHLSALIAAHGLELAVLPPHPDGAVDVLPLVRGRPLAKWSLPHLAARMFPGAALSVTHGGDGAGDLPAMEAPGVVALSSESCPVTREAARARGVVAGRSAPEGGAAVECWAELARRGFHGPLAGEVARLCEAALRTWGS